MKLRKHLCQNGISVKLLVLLFAFCMPLSFLNADYMKADDGAKVYYNVKGEGPTVLFIHGLLVNSLFWEANVNKLSKDFQVITIDMRGHGYTVDGPVPNYTIERVARDVKQLLDELGVEETTLVGWSTGAFVAYKYVELFGDYKLNGVTAVDMPPRVVIDEEWQYGSNNMDQLNAMVVGIQYADFDIRSGSVFHIFAEGAEISEDVYDFVHRNFMLSPREAFISFINELAVSDFRELLKSFPVPVLYCYGEKSMFYPNDAGDWMEDNLPDNDLNEVEEFEKSGHYLQFEEAKKFNKTLKEFLEEVYDLDD